MPNYVFFNFLDTIDLWNNRLRQNYKLETLIFRIKTTNGETENFIVKTHSIIEEVMLFKSLFVLSQYLNSLARYK